MLSDAEVICNFMEPLESIDCSTGGKRSLADWWRRETEWSVSLKWKPWVPATLTLDALHKVEKRLTDDQWWKYETHIIANAPDRDKHQELLELIKCHIHADAPTRTKALAAVLRSAE